MIEVHVDENLSDALSQLARAYDDMQPAFESIGEYLIESTRRRFASGTSPDGTPWAAKSPATVGRYLAQKMRPDPRPLHQSLELVSTLSFATGRDYVQIGSNVLQAAVMQFGARKGEFGAYSGINRKGHPYSGVAPWGDIPARPYLGLSQEDQVNIRVMLADYLTAVVPGGA